MASQLSPQLATRDASAILEPTYARKVGDSREDGQRVAIIVNHGMGQQVPYETIEGVAKAVWKGLPAGASGATTPQCRIRTVRLGTEGKDAVETELVRAEIEFQHDGHAYDVHIYESYWAPLTEGKVTLKDVMLFLFDAGWNGFLNTESRTYQRWMFDKEHKFKLPKVRLMFILISLMVLLLALVVMNAVLTAAAASHAIGGSSTFPGPSVAAPLTSDFIVADFAALLIALGTLILPLLYKRARKRAVPPWLSRLGWFLIILGAVLIVLAAFAMPFQLAGYPPNGFRWPFVSARAAWLSQGQHIVWITILWGIELLAAYAGRWVLVEYVGDVVAYIAAHTVSKFYELRQQIWQTAMKVSRAVYRAQAGHKASSDAPGFLYDKIIMVGHSLGSVIGYDVLNGLLLEDAFSKDPLRVAQRTRMFLTFGSPLDKTAFLFRTQREMCSPVQEVAATAVQPMIQDYQNRPKEWVNLHSTSDIISGNLDFYDPPDKDNAKDKTPFLNPFTAPKKDERAVKNETDPDARTPLAAHVEYWDGQLLADKLVLGITT